MDTLVVKRLGYIFGKFTPELVALSDIVHPRAISPLCALNAVLASPTMDMSASSENIETASPEPDVPAVPALAQINPQFLRRRLALVEDDDGQPHILLSDAVDQGTSLALQFALGQRVEPTVRDRSEIQARLHSAFPAFDALDQHSPSGNGPLSDELDLGAESSIILLIERLLEQAASAGASDVHIEPMAREIVVRQRLDGQLIERERLPLGLARPIASRIKVIAGLDIAESRLPQDGRIRFSVSGRPMDVRVSTSATTWGESIVLRLLGRTDQSLDLAALGLPATALAQLHHALDRPHGLILVTGPTGSGKTTTLYAALNRLRGPAVKILTVEDPVEILLDGVNQVQVRPEIDLTYANALRAFLRQDPDILMVGEIRDGETADIAMRAALTGHLVLSTLHTNSALGAFTRLADIGIQPYLTASTVIASVAQRLVRKLCERCRSPRAVTPSERDIFTRTLGTLPEQIHDPAGCDSCQHTGYAGRVPIVEIVEVDDRLRERIKAGRAEEQAGDIAPAETLFGHGLTLVAERQTSLAEVARATQLV